MFLFESKLHKSMRWMPIETNAINIMDVFNVFRNIHTNKQTNLNCKERFKTNVGLCDHSSFKLYSDAVLSLHTFYKCVIDDD